MPCFIDASAWGTKRASAHSSAMPCSAAATVLAVGALTTSTPASVAATRSTLSMPTPARPTVFRRPAPAANTSLVTLVAERTISASHSEILAMRSACGAARRVSAAAR